MKRICAQTAELPFELSGECGLLIEVTLAIHFTWFPAERASWTEPGCSESIEVESATLVFGKETLHEFTDLKRFEPQVWEWLAAQVEEVL